MFSNVETTAAEQRAGRPGNELVTPADVVMDRAFTVDAPPAAVWPWLVQLGGRNATFAVAEPAGDAPVRTWVFLRLRMVPVRRQRLARTVGELIDLLTVAGMAAGLAERLRSPDGPAATRQ